MRRTNFVPDNRQPTELPLDNRRSPGYRASSRILPHPSISWIGHNETGRYSNAQQAPIGGRLVCVKGKG